MTHTPETTLPLLFPGIWPDSALEAATDEQKRYFLWCGHFEDLDGEFMGQSMPASMRWSHPGDDIPTKEERVANPLAGTYATEESIKFLRDNLAYYLEHHNSGDRIPWIVREAAAHYQYLCHFREAGHERDHDEVMALAKGSLPE